MLPPQLQQGLRPRSLSMPAAMTTRASAGCTIATAQSRSCWTWRRQADYASHIDPQFQRFCRYRTLKTRAKLLDKLRRRGRWDWDVDQRPFFSPRHVRLASHIGRPRWRQNENDGDKKEPKEAAEDEGFELNEREKEWKEQMEAMRRRIEQDPYEAVFGKRFEPFWSPLVPTWMREEMGLSRWPKQKEKTIPYKPVSAEAATSIKTADAASPNGQLTEYAYPENKKPTSSTTDPDSPNGQLTSYSYSRKKPASDNPDSPNGQLTSYSYSSSTSWDSWTKKARRDEWDSISGQRRRFEYDPISNRMVQVQHPSARAQEKSQLREPSTEPVERSASTANSTAVDVPVKTAVEPRKAIPVPTTTAEDNATQTSRYFPSLLKNALVTETSNAAAVSQAPEKALDTLTADDIRASMGKTRLDRANKYSPQAAQMQPASPLQPAVERMQSRELPAVPEPDDSAAHESTGEAIDYSTANLPRDWEKQADLLQADRVRRTRGTPEASDNAPMESRKKLSTPRWIDIMNAQKASYEATMAAEKKLMEARDAEKNARAAKAKSMLEAEVQDQKLRLMAYENRYAHGALADIQQALHEKQPNQTQQVSATQDAASERARYQQKIRDLRKELDTSFKQSSVSSEMHLDRIRDLEKELALARNFGHDTLQVEKDRYMQKNKALKEELDRTFKQSSVNSEMQVERIRDLERELADARSGQSASSQSVEATRAEGDFCANVTKYAKDNSKWYKKPCHNPEATGKATQAEFEAAQRNMQDKALVTEIKDIYEARYGPIDTMKAERKSAPEQLEHETKDIYEARYGPIDTVKTEQQVVEVETDVDLGKALADYEKEQEYEFRKPNKTFEAEVAQQEKEYHEAQASVDPYPETCGKAKTNKGTIDQDVYGSRSTEDRTPTVLPTESTSTSATFTNEAQNSSIEWEDPPVYKVLAYDSGNDLFSMAVTSSNFTGKETPISIPEALSQLYQPARFVPHFAELQREGYQVISATKDLLVFKKVKDAPKAPPATLQDHGLLKEKHLDAKPYPAGVNPIDGMSYIEPHTGSFASPTGFVGDRWDAFSNKSQTSPRPEETRSSPRVKREEQVFSGSRLNKKDRKAAAKEAKRKWRGWQNRVTWALSVGLGASAVAYTVGAIAERQEERRLRRGRWE